MKTKRSKIGRRGKTVLAVLIAVMFIGVASAALLTYYGKVTTEVNILQSVRLDGKVYSGGYDSITSDDEIGDIVAGSCKWGNDHWLSLESGAQDYVDVEVDKSDPVDEFTVFIAGEVDAGADFSDYEAPSDPDVIVDTIAELEDAVNNGINNEVILVKAGTYTPGYKLEIEDSDQLYAEYAPNSANPSVIEKGIAPMQVDSVIISGFVINGGVPIWASFCEVSYNIISTDGVGVSLFGFSGGSNNLVTNNEISGSGDPEDAGIHIQGSGNTVEYNTIEGFTRGEAPSYTHGKKGAGILVWALTDDTTIEYNEITGNTIGVMVTGPDNPGVTSATDVDVNYNNIVGNADYGVFNAKCPGNDYSGDWSYWEYEKYTPADSIVDATENWWGYDGIDVSDNVDATWFEWKDGDKINLQPGERKNFKILYCADSMGVGDGFTASVSFK